MITPLRGKWGIALRVEAEKTPYGVIRRLFGTTKLRSSCLVWRFFSFNSGNNLIENGP
jgi:hypothetical protein